MSEPMISLSAAYGHPDCRKCDEGWICETHPDREWPHEDCAGPGMPCDAPGCLLEQLRACGCDT